MKSLSGFSNSRHLAQYFASITPQKLPYPPNHLKGEVNIGEAEDAPTGQGGLVVFFHVGDEARSAVVASVDPDAAFDFDERARGDVGEVGAPLARWVEPKFPFECGTLNGEPEEFEAAFQAGTMVAVAETLAGDYHPLDWESTCAVSG